MADVTVRNKQTGKVIEMSEYAFESMRNEWERVVQSYQGNEPTFIPDTKVEEKIKAIFNEPAKIEETFAGEPDPELEVKPTKKPKTNKSPKKEAE